jgi:uncharacterized membrane protein (DUF106 family)
MPPDNQSPEMKQLLKKNRELLEENNELLKKIHRNALWSFWLRVVWYVFLIGLPFALYFYVLEPYFDALGSSYEVFSAGIQEIPGWKQFNAAIDNFKAHTGE